MAFLNKAKKTDLLELSEELGEPIPSQAHVFEIRKIIQSSKYYEVEDVKMSLLRIMEEREKREEFERQEKERREEFERQEKERREELECQEKERREEFERQEQREELERQEQREELKRKLALEEKENEKHMLELRRLEVLNQQRQDRTVSIETVRKIEVLLN